MIKGRTVNKSQHVRVISCASETGMEVEMEHVADGYVARTLALRHVRETKPSQVEEG